MGGCKTVKITIMLLILKVDLQCSGSYKKVKKILCKFPEIRDQVYDEKANTVKITVVCCNPEKFRDKLCCKGCCVIESIKIIEEEDPPGKTEKPQQIEVKVEPIHVKVEPIQVNVECHGRCACYHPCGCGGRCRCSSYSISSCSCHSSSYSISSCGVSTWDSHIIQQNTDVCSIM